MPSTRFELLAYRLGGGNSGPEPDRELTYRPNRLHRISTARETHAYGERHRHLNRVTQLKSRNDLIDELSLSRSSVWRMTNSADFPPPVRIGGAVRWKATDIDRWMETQRGTPVRRPTRYIGRYTARNAPPVVLVPVGTHA